VALVAGGLFAYWLVNTVVCARLLERWRRVRRTPELLLGLALLSSASVGYPLVVLASAVPEIGAFAAPLGLLSFQVGVSLYAHFNARVFRPGVAWASALSSACTHVFASVFVVAAYLPWVLDSPEQVARRLLPFALANQCTLFGICTWTALEGGRYYAMMRRRAALAMADPLVVNRFLLWTLLGSLQAANMAVALLLMLAGEDVTRSPLSIACTSANGLASSVLTALIFMPPAWYSRRIAGSRARARA
jgi:hypothetical protein